MIRRRQHELLRSWSVWTLTSILLEPAEVARVREAGWSQTHHRDPATGTRIVGSEAGVGFGVDEPWRDPAEVIPWSEVAAVATAVRAEVRDDLRSFRERWREHHSCDPRFTASAEAVGCGRIIEGRALTPRQEAYVRELQTFEDSGVLPAWQERCAALEAERLELHDRALPVSGNTEPADLLDLFTAPAPTAPAAPGAAGAAAAAERTVESAVAETNIQAGDETTQAASRPALRPPTGEPTPQRTGAAPAGPDSRPVR